MNVKQTAHKLWVYWSISYTFRGERQERENREWKGSGVCCPSAVTDLIFDFAHLSTRFTVKFNSRLTAEKRVSLSLSFLLSVHRVGLLWSFIVTYFCTRLDEMCRKAPPTFRLFLHSTSNNNNSNKNQFNASNIWRSMQTATTSGLNAHKNTRIYGIYNILYLNLFMPAKYFWQQLKYLPYFV